MTPPTDAGGLQGPLAAAYEKSLDCVHCGLCLPACPTYRETGREISSPRGRIYLMRGVAEGRLPLADAAAREMYLCLGCRACETACPSGVRFGSLLEDARAAVEGAGLRRGWRKRLESLALRHVVARPIRLRRLVDLVGALQRSRLDRLALRLAPRRLRELHGMLPEIAPRAARAALPERVDAQGPRRGRVGLLVGCVASQLFAGENAATVRVLARNGFDVLVPRDQGCCGALHAHAGDADFARELARKNVAAFAAAGVETVVSNSAGCGAALREVGEWLPGEGEAFAGGARDVCELLDEVGLRAPSGRVEARVCYDDPCHLIHGQRVREAPRRLLAAVPGVELVPHDEPDACCGAAGIYNLTHPDMSAAVLSRKVAALAAADPDLVASGNPGCLMQLRAGVQRAGLRALVVHPVEILDRAYHGPG